MLFYPEFASVLLFKILCFYFKNSLYLAYYGGGAIISSLSYEFNVLLYLKKQLVISFFLYTDETQIQVF